MSTIAITTPLSIERRRKLKAGQSVFLSGTIYTARDAAHLRFMETLDRGEALPFSLLNNLIYYVGPSPTRPGHVIGAAGPTTASRMDPFMPRLLDLGLGGTIGKGFRSQVVIDAMVRHQAVFFGAIGGAAAVLAASIKKQDVIAYDDLGAEAVRRLEVENMPLIVLIDSQGHNLYEDGPAAWRHQSER